CIPRSTFFFFFQAEDGIRDFHVTGVQTCALPIWKPAARVGRNREGSGTPSRVLPARMRTGRGGLNWLGEGLLPPAWRAVRAGDEIGRASCRERGERWGGGGAWKKKGERDERQADE